MALAMISNRFIAFENFGHTVCSYDVNRSERYPRRSRVSRELHFAFDRTWNCESPERISVATPDGKAASLPPWLGETSDQYSNFGDVLRSTKIPPHHPAYAWIYTRARVHRVKAMDVSRWDDHRERLRTQHRVLFRSALRPEDSCRRSFRSAFRCLSIGCLSVSLYASRGPFAHTPRERRRLVAPR